MHKSDKLLPMSKQNASENLLTMSSREIAKLCGKEHRHVLRDIENLNQTYEEMGLPKIGQGYYTHPNTGNQQHREFLLSREQCVDLITGYRTDVRIRINRRWQELESQQAVRLPQNFAEALRDLADTVEQNQVLQLENNQKTEHIHSLENYFQAGLTPPQFVKGLNGVNCQKINDFLRSKGWLYKDNSRCWRVFGHVRNKYLTEQSKRIEIDPIERVEMNTYKPVLLEKGAVKIFEFYMKGELPMRADWDGKFYHSKVAV
ncbi:Rha family transcriptional regulator [Frederiksenia canicola]|uniref:Antirepressor n=1 Tax=Frederiksenia canicola TaxID=123824 RepID=A0AAE6X5F3_9PAST|nr:Rha family transcriptional regulator [Frederiksenia canicola]QIM65240.1 antirepressor [Frederiksenia canicola]RPE96332.1 regulatory protein Rha [Frederiksenia canicola]